MRNSLKYLLTILILTIANVHPMQAGWLVRYIYLDLTGTAITNLTQGTDSTGQVPFPDLPGD